MHDAPRAFILERSAFSVRPLQVLQARSQKICPGNVAVVNSFGVVHLWEQNDRDAHLLLLL